MFLCELDAVTAGARLGAAVLNPASPERELLKPGVVLTERLLERLRHMGVAHIWIDDDLVRDLDRAVGDELTKARLALYSKMKEDIGCMSQASLGAGQVAMYRQVISGLVCQAVGNSRFSGMTDQLFAAQSSLFSHCVNVAMLSILTGLELEAYIVRERPRLSSEHARDLISLGLGALLHDVGKTQIDSEMINTHEVTADADPPREPSGSGTPAAGEPSDPASAYDKHTLAGYGMFRHARASTSVTQIVLNHHQRFDGNGWPDQAEAFGPRYGGTQAGRRIHVFTRIVAAANVLENLLRSGDGAARPPVAALYDFASTRFDGWFDPVVRRAMLRKIPPFGVGCLLTLSDGRRAVVLQPSLNDPCRPVVRLMEESGGEGIVNLAQHPEVHVARCLGQDVAQWLFDLQPVPEPENNAPAAAGDTAMAASVAKRH